MIRTKYFFYFCFINIFLFSTTGYSQNFDETWKEFLENNKISNMSRLVRPNKAVELLSYSKYLLMSTNNNFCQSKIEKAEILMEEMQEIDSEVFEAIPGFVTKMEDLQTKIKASHTIDEIWNRFLKTKDVTVEELEDVYPPSTICEKRTLVKYSYMTAHYYYCGDEFEEAKSTFQNRTLKIAEKTSLRIKEVKGLEREVANMKSLFKNLPKLDEAWDTYIETGESPGFNIKLPVFACNPIPNMKEFILKGVADPCNSGPKMLKKFKKLQAKSGVELDYEIEEKLEELEKTIGENRGNLSTLNKAWKAFLKEDKVVNTKYKYEYCQTEPLIRAYIMDGFSFPCDLAEGALEEIDALRKSDKTPLKPITKTKIKELRDLMRQYAINGEEVEMLWKRFVSQGDTLYDDNISSNLYCDNIQQVKDWTMNGLAGTCQQGIPYLEKIEEFNETFDFTFYEELECRVQKLRRRIYDCRYESLLNLAILETSPETYQDRLAELMEEYGFDGERPEDCVTQE